MSSLKYFVKSNRLDLDHPFLVNLVRTYKDNHRLYLLLELVGGGDMLDALDHLGMLKREYAQFYIGTNILIFYDNSRTMIHFLVSLRLGRVE